MIKVRMVMGRHAEGLGVEDGVCTELRRVFPNVRGRPRTVTMVK